nr:MAG TPA: hypothetical protein [Caudoviricetes sp.]
MLRLKKTNILSLIFHTGIIRNPTPLLFFLISKGFYSTC